MLLLTNTELAVFVHPLQLKNNICFYVSLGTVARTGLTMYVFSLQVAATCRFGHAQVKDIAKFLGGGVEWVAAQGGIQEEL